MNATVLLVLLTLKAGAPLGVNFVNFDALPACQARSDVLQKVLTKGGIKVVENRCVESIQHFSKHHHGKTKGDHGRKATAKTHAYLVALNDHRALVIPQTDLKSCETAKADREKAGGKTRYYCAMSEQTLLCEGALEAEKRAKQKM